jgi:hypothetical protein
MMPANGLPQRRRRSVLLVATANQSRHNRRLWIMPGDEQPVAFDPDCVKTFFRLQKLHATGDDLRRHDDLSVFLLYRVWSQPGRNLGLR